MVCLILNCQTAGTIGVKVLTSARLYLWEKLFRAHSCEKKRRQLWSSQNSQRVPVVLQISGGAAEPSPWSAAPLVGGQDTRCDAWQIWSIKICSTEPTIGAHRGKISGFNVEDKQLGWNCLQSGKTFTRAAQGPACDLWADLGFEPGCWDDCQGDWSSLHRVHKVTVCARGYSAALLILRCSGAPRLVVRPQTLDILLLSHCGAMIRHSIITPYTSALNISPIVIELHTRERFLEATVNTLWPLSRCKPLLLAHKVHPEVANRAPGYTVPAGELAST